MVRVVQPGSTRNFFEVHDASSWKCLEAILQTPSEGAWANWSDNLAMIRRRHPIVAAQLVEQLEGHPQTSFLLAAADARRQLQLAGVMGFDHNL